MVEKSEKKKVRFRNRSESLQVIYDESGTKRELVPGGTIILDNDWGGRFRCLEKATATPPKKDEGKEEKEKVEVPPEE